MWHWSRRSKWDLYTHEFDIFCLSQKCRASIKLPHCTYRNLQKASFTLFLDISRSPVYFLFKSQLLFYREWGPFHFFLLAKLSTGIVVSARKVRLTRMSRLAGGLLGEQANRSLAMPLFKSMPRFFCFFFHKFRKQTKSCTYLTKLVIILVNCNIF